MKVVHVNEHLSIRGGVETYLHALLPQLQAVGVDCLYVYDKGEGASPFRTERVPQIGRAAFGANPTVYRRLLQLLQDEQPDVVHVHNIQNVGVLQACLTYGPTILTTHDYRFICPASNFFFKRTREICTRPCVGPGCLWATARKRCMTLRPSHAPYFYYRARWAIGNAKRLSAVVAPSEGTRKRLLAAGFESSSLTVVPYFCPIEPAPIPRVAPRQPTITFVGRTALNKGADVFVDALSLLPKSMQGVMVGNLDARGREDLARRARELGCGERLHFHPWSGREAVIRLLDSTTVLIFPSLWPETLGIVGLEALSRGVPVVASDVGGVREWLYPGKNGYLVPPKSPKHIAAAVEALISDPDGLDRLGYAAIRTITERFLPEHHIAALMALYQQFPANDKLRSASRALSETAP